MAAAPPADHGELLLACLRDVSATGKICLRDGSAKPVYELPR